MHDHPSDILLGLAGILAPALGVITSFQEQLEWWFRMCSLGAGIVVAAVTVWSILRKGRARP